MCDIFTYRDDAEGKVGIGRLPNDIQSTLGDIGTIYHGMVPDKSTTTFHTWFRDMPPGLKQKVEKLQKNRFWNKLCDSDTKCVKLNVHEMDELYYSNPKSTDTTKNNLYGASNYYIHRDCIFRFRDIRFYRVLVGISDGNDSVATNLTNLNMSHKLNKGDYILFDFDRTLHQVIKTGEGKVGSPRILLKLHFIVCGKCRHSKEYIHRVKTMYIYYEYVTRAIMNYGTEPTTFPRFFVGILVQYFFSRYKFAVLGLTIVVILLTSKKDLGVLATMTRVLATLLFLHVMVVCFFWARYKLMGVR
jgi:hypothetical protein